MERRNRGPSESPNNKTFGSSRVLVELGKIHQHSLLKVGKVAKTVSHAFHCFYRVVNSLNNTRRDAMGKIV